MPMTNLFYVVFDDDKNVIKIVRDPEENDNYFPIEPKEVIDFLLGTKNYQAYYVKLNDVNKPTIVKKTEQSVDEVFVDLFKIPTNLQNDLQIIHDSDNKMWNFSLDPNVIKNINREMLNLSLQFYICKSSQHNFLIRNINFILRDVIECDKNFNFISDYELDFQNLQVFSKKNFTSIGIKNV